jgi:hypothetical protein
MDHRYVPDLLTALSNASWPVTVLRIQMSDYRDEDLAEVGSGGGGRMSMAGSGKSAMPGMGMKMPSSGPSGSSAASGKSSRPIRQPASRGDDEAVFQSQGERSALDDPNLAHVAIVGLIYIMNKPEEKAPVAGTPSPATVTAPASTSPTAPASAPQTGAPAAEGAPAEAEGDRPADEPAGDEPEKPADADKPTEDAKDEPADNPAKSEQVPPQLKTSRSRK